MIIMTVHAETNASENTEVEPKPEAEATTGRSVGGTITALPGRLSLRSKIISPYIVLSTLVTLLAAYIVSLVVISGLEERFQNQLLTTTGEAADAVVRYEEEQLALWRQIAFTEGVADATRNGDVDELRQLVEPIFVNENASRIDIVDPEGKGLAIFSQSDNDALSDYGQWILVRESEQNPSSRYAGLKAVGDEVIFFTAGALPFDDDGQPSGTLLVGTPLDDLTVWLQTQVLAAGVTIYSLDGQMLASTVGRSVPAELAMDRQMASETLDIQGSGGPMRNLTLAGDDFAQVLTPFELQGGQDVGIMGVSLPLSFVTSPLYPTRDALVVIFTVTLFAIVLIGYLLAASIGRPIERLTRASKQVAGGDLSVQVETVSTDEIGQLTNSFNTMVTQLRQRKYIEDLFGRYVGSDIAQRILSGEVALGGHRIWATVLFADIRGFTVYSERADLSELIDELNEYYSIMQQEIEAHGGVINKFGGDSILALFGAPLPLDDHACKTVKASLAMMDQLGVLNRRRRARGDMPIRVGIGVHTGEMVVGNLGSEMRREYTVLGDSVNTAKRISDLNKESPFPAVFVSGSTKAELDVDNGWQIDNLGEVVVKGKAEQVSVFAVMHSISDTEMA